VQIPASIIRKQARQAVRDKGAGRNALAKAWNAGGSFRPLTLRFRLRSEVTAGQAVTRMAQRTIPTKLNRYARAKRISGDANPTKRRFIKSSDSLDA
jgi:hypothetical protein